MTYPFDEKPWKGLALGSLVSLGVFSGLALYTTTISYMILSKTNPDLTWGLVFSSHFSGWLSEMALAPLLFLLARFFRPTADRKSYPLLIHFIASLVWMPIRSIIHILAILALNPAEMRDPYEQFLKGLFPDYYWYWILALAAFAWFNFKDYLRRTNEAALLGRLNAELHQQLTQAELYALKAQIQPHFLFNTHNAIAGLIRADRKEQALQALSDLSSLFRYTLENEKREMVTLGQELTFLEHFFNIQKLRFGDRLTIETIITDDARQVEIPVMLLQPLLENAVHHGGVAHCEHSFVRLKAEIVGALLFIEIRNSVDPTAPDSSGFGIGLTNLKARLNRYYDHRYHFEMELIGEDEMVVDLHLPIHQNRSTPP